MDTKMSSRLWYEQSYFQNLHPEDKECLSVMLRTWHGRYSTKRDAWSIPVDFKPHLERFVQRHEQLMSIMSTIHPPSTIPHDPLTKNENHDENIVTQSDQSTQTPTTIEWELPSELFELMETFWTKK